MSLWSTILIYKVAIKDKHTYLVVLVSVIADQNRSPEGVESVGAQDNISVIELMVVGKPASDKSPEVLNSWVRPESGSLLWLAA